MGESKRVGVLFSGGLDSTYLVWRNLEDGNEVVPIYIEISNNENKSKLEKNRIEALWKLFDDVYGNKIDRIVYSIKIDINAADNLTFKQVPVWVSGLVYSQNHGVQELQIGYVGGDDAIGHLDDIKKIYKSYQHICDRPLRNLVFPLKKEHKYNLMEDLPAIYRELLVSCEAPRLDNENTEVIEYTPCGYCPPCIKIMQSHNFGTGLSPKYRKCVVDWSFNMIREHHDDEVKVDIDEENEIEHISRPYPCTLKMKSAYQMQIPFDEVGKELQYEKAE